MTAAVHEGPARQHLLRPQQALTNCQVSWVSQLRNTLVSRRAGSWHSGDALPRVTYAVRRPPGSRAVRNEDDIVAAIR